MCVGKKKPRVMTTSPPLQRRVGEQNHPQQQEAAVVDKKKQGATRRLVASCSLPLRRTGSAPSKSKQTTHTPSSPIRIAKKLSGTNAKKAHQLSVGQTAVMVEELETLGSSPKPETSMPSSCTQSCGREVSDAVESEQSPYKGPQLALPPLLDSCGSMTTLTTPLTSPSIIGSSPLGCPSSSCSPKAMTPLFLDRDECGESRVSCGNGLLCSSLLAFDSHQGAAGTTTHVPASLSSMCEPASSCTNPSSQNQVLPVLTLPPPKTPLSKLRPWSSLGSNTRPLSQQTAPVLVNRSKSELDEACLASDEDQWSDSASPVLRPTTHIRLSPTSTAIPARLVQTIDEAQQALQQGATPPEPLNDGMGGVYVLHGLRSQSLAIFKPCDEEVGCDENPKGHTPSQNCHNARSGIVPGEAALREVAAYALDAAYNNFSGVPPTTLVDCDLAGSPVAANLKWYNSKRGSLQCFVESECSSEDLSYSMFPVAEVQKIALLDIRLMNLDRHEGNILVSRNADKSIKLTPIDHGCCLPNQIRVSCFEWCWLDWPQAHQPLLPELQAQIKSLDFAKDLQALAEAGVHLSSECLSTLRITTTLLQAALKVGGCTLHDIAMFVCRNGGSTDLDGAPSLLEKVLAKSMWSHTVTSESASRNKRSSRATTSNRMEHVSTGTVHSSRKTNTTTATKTTAAFGFSSVKQQTNKSQVDDQSVPATPAAEDEDVGYRGMNSLTMMMESSSVSQLNATMCNFAEKIVAREAVSYLRQRISERKGQGPVIGC